MITDIAMLTNEVQNRAEGLSRQPAQAAAKLPEEERWTVRGAKQEQRVDSRNVEALVEEID